MRAFNSERERTKYFLDQIYSARTKKNLFKYVNYIGESNTSQLVKVFQDCVDGLGDDNEGNVKRETARVMADRLNGIFMRKTDYEDESGLDLGRYPLFRGQLFNAVLDKFGL